MASGAVRAVLDAEGFPRSVMPMRRAIRRAGAVVALTLLALAGAYAVSWLVRGRAVHYGALASSRIDPDTTSAGPWLLDRLTLTTTHGNELSCGLRRPRRPHAPRLTAVVLSGGMTGGPDQPRLVDPAFRGIVIACDYLWRAPDVRGALDFLWQLPRLRAGILATPRMLGLSADYLASRTDVDPRCVVAVGASLGVYPVAAWAAGDSRARAVALLQGGDLEIVLDAALARYVNSGFARRRYAALGARLFAPLDPPRVVSRIAPRPLLVVGARDDEQIPRTAVEAVHAAAGEPKSLRWIDAGHLRGFEDTTQLRMLFDEVRNWQRDALPQCY